MMAVAWPVHAGPVGNVWSTLASIPTPVAEGGAAVVGGTLYVADGLQGAGSVASSQMWEYAIATNSWQQGAPDLFARTGITAAAGQNGKMYVFDGTIGSSVMDYATVFDPTRNAWQQVASDPVPRTGASAVLMANGDIMVAGGSTTATNPTPTASVSAYDPTNNSWQTLPAMNEAVTNASAVALGGKIYVMGGTIDSGGSLSPSNLLQVYDPTVSGGNPWSLFVPLPVAVEAGVGGAINGALVIAGGIATNGSPTSTAAAFDPTTDFNWSVIASLPTSLYAAATGAISTGNEMFVIGGQNASGLLSSSYEMSSASPVAEPNGAASAAVGLMALAALATRRRYRASQPIVASGSASVVRR